MIYAHKNTRTEYSFLPEKRAAFLAQFWEVRYSDENGKSTLARVKTKQEAQARARHFRSVLANGGLLAPDKTADL